MLLRHIPAMIRLITSVEERGAMPAIRGIPANRETAEVPALRAIGHLIRFCAQHHSRLTELNPLVSMAAAELVITAIRVQITLWIKPVRRIVSSLLRDHRHRWWAAVMVRHFRMEVAPPVF